VLDSAAEPQAGGEADGAAGERLSRTPAKGHPTPKRSEAEKRRRQPYGAPADRKAASSKTKESDRAARQAKMAALRRGEEWALPAKDKGKVRGLARDYVDSRHTLSEYYLFAVIVMIAMLFIPGLRQTIAVDLVVLVILAILIVEGWFTGRRVLRLAGQRFPGESTRGLRMYAALRSTQIRRMRMPPPRVGIGDKI
jgi:Protein of unknown function (DUF3043)